MQYIKAKFENSKRSYTYRTEDDVKPGDIVTNDKGSKLTVVDEPVDAAWIRVHTEQTRLRLLRNMWSRKRQKVRIDYGK